jgi:hypothetical protein
MRQRSGPDLGFEKASESLVILGEAELISDEPKEAPAVVPLIEARRSASRLRAAFDPG